MSADKVQTNEEFRAFLKQLRESQNLTQGQLAAELGLGKAYVGFIEQGVRNPSRKVIYGLANYFGVNADALMDLAFGSSPATSTLLMTIDEEQKTKPNTLTDQESQEELETRRSHLLSPSAEFIEDEGVRLLMRMNWAIDCMENDKLSAHLLPRGTELHAIPRSLQLSVIVAYQAQSGRILMTDEELALGRQMF